MAEIVQEVEIHLCTMSLNVNYAQYLHKVICLYFTQLDAMLHHL